MSTVDQSRKRRTATRLPRLVPQGSHQTRALLPNWSVSSVPFSVSSMSRRWTERCVSGTSSATARALTAGAELSRIAVNSSSSLTVRGRPPAPIDESQPRQVIIRTDTSERQLEVATRTRHNQESRFLWAALNAPARRSARGRLSEGTPMKATSTEVIDSIECSGSSRRINHSRGDQERAV